MYELLYGFIIGALTIGSTTYRTVKVIEGKVLPVATSSILHSVLYYYAMKQIINNDMMGYAGFSIGAALSTCYLAYKQRK